MLSSALLSELDALGGIFFGWFFPARRCFGFNEEFDFSAKWFLSPLIMSTHRYSRSFACGAGGCRSGSCVSWWFWGVWSWWWLWYGRMRMIWMIFCVDLPYWCQSRRSISYLFLCLLSLTHLLKIFGHIFAYFYANVIWAKDVCHTGLHLLLSVDGNGMFVVGSFETMRADI